VNAFPGEFLVLDFDFVAFLGLERTLLFNLFFFDVVSPRVLLSQRAEPRSDLFPSWEG